MLDFFEIFFSEPKERGAIEFGVAADVVMGSRFEGVSLFIDPFLAAVVFAFEEDFSGISIRFFTGQKAASFDDEDFSSRAGQLVGESASSSAAPQNHRIVAF